jgi:hypothetical protein
MIEGDITAGMCLYHVNDRREHQEFLASSKKKKKHLNRSYVIIAFVLSPSMGLFFGETMLMCVIYSDDTYTISEIKTKELRARWSFAIEL